MSHQLINRNDDLKRLQDDGYEVRLANGYLIINNIPYVNNKKQVVRGTIISTLNLEGGSTLRPNTHVALWAGEYPCDHNGMKFEALVHSSTQESICDELIARYKFSQKPPEGYSDYYHKMTTYIRMLEEQARVVDPDATAKTFSPIPLTGEESVFCYMDTASSRAGITSINDKLKGYKIAIVGLGGTGSYILDLVAKTSVKEIHLFDNDKFFLHNVFRSPGAPSFDDLEKKPTKIEWFAEIYSRMRRKIIPHQNSIDESNVSELNSMDFVFLCIDKGRPRKIMVEYMIKNNISFIDTGIGIVKENEKLTGCVRVTACTPLYNHAKTLIPFDDDDDEDDVYSSNIQIADMNALSAILAVIKWKKICGFYHDFGYEHNIVYGISTNTVTTNEILNENKRD